MADRTEASHRAGDGADPIGSAAQEAIKLLRALASGNAHTGHDHDGHDHAEAGPDPVHLCPNGWCPVCKVADWVRENPDMVDTATESALALARTLRDGLDSFLSGHDRDREDRTP